MKNIIKSLLIVVAVAAIAGGATYAYFSDTEISVGNTFSAGTLDLKVNGQDIIEHIVLNNLKPGDGEGGAEHSTIQYQYTFSNGGSIIGQPWIEMKNFKNKENNCIETENDSTCAELEGELGDNLMMKVNAPGDVGFVYLNQANCLDSGSLCPIKNWVALDSIGLLGQKWQTIAGNSVLGGPMVLEFELPSSTGNIVQSDSIEFDIVFHLDQVQ